MQAFFGKGKLTHVVEEGSARFDVDISYTSNRDHFGVSKVGGENDSSFQRLTTLIDEVIPAIAPGPAEPIADRRENACNELVNSILRQLPNQNAILISSHQLQEISEFPEKDRHLSECLKNAGFEEISRSGASSLWDKCQS